MCRVGRWKSRRERIDIGIVQIYNRIISTVPSSSTGLDICGPSFTRSRETINKVDIALFTCASVRAIHLERVPTMSTPDTQLAIRRFLAAHPGCVHLVSDNARSFVKAASDIKRLFNSLRDPDVRELLAQRRVRWSFSCPRAPWHGGLFERLVGTVKVALSKTLGRSLVSYAELRTIVCEVAAVVNDRPITYVAADLDAVQPISSAQFFHGGPLGPALASLTSLDALRPTSTGITDSASSPELRSALLQRTS